VVKYIEIFIQTYIFVFYCEIERMDDMEIEESEAKGVESGRDTYSESVVEAKGEGRGERSLCWTETTACSDDEHWAPDGFGFW
jgi:hypothetical protein